MREGPPPLPADTEAQSNSREKLPVAEVSNEVVWVNSAFPNAPFDLREGESTSLGVFLTSSQDEARHVGVAEYHKRTGVLGQVIFEDIDGRHYRDVDVKGVGYTETDDIDLVSSPHKLIPKVQTPEPSEKGVYGLMDRSVALKDASMAEELISNGVRTYRAIGVTKLNEIVIPANPRNPASKAEKITIETARERGIVPEGYEPAVEIRAFGTHRRVQDLESTQISEIDRQSYVADAKKLVAQELGISHAEFSDESYLQWFGKTLAESVARLHKAGYTDGYLTKHNITLDCRIVDLDSVTPMNTIHEKRGDFNQSLITFIGLAKVIAAYTGMIENFSSDDLQQLFLRAYSKELEPKIKSS